MSSTLAEQYAAQAQWRDWGQVLERLPLRRGDRVVDLGCGLGDATSLLNELGAEVLGIDQNEELLRAARARHPALRFARMDLKQLTRGSTGEVDGLWASFVTAYFPQLEPVLSGWASCLRPGGWIALTEVDDLLGHEPFPAGFREEISAFYESSRRSGRYDFEGGRRLRAATSAIGLTIVRETVIADQELSFDGAAAPGVLEAWRARLQRMSGLQDSLGGRFGDFARGFLQTLASNEHVSRTKVIHVVARRDE